MSRNLNGIIYINLDRRTDRRAQIEEELRAFGLKGERFAAIDEGGGIGCTKSHLEVLKVAKKRGYRNVLILEDDFMFTVSRDELEHNLSELFEGAINFDVCMLSYNMFQSKPTSWPFLSKVLEAQTASGYIVNSQFYDSLISSLETAAAMLEQTHQHWLYMNDQYWKSLQPNSNWFAFTPRCGKQRGSFSDNSGKYEDYNL